MALLEESFHSLEYRAAGCLIGVLLTFLVYLVLRRAAAESIRIKVIAAAIACVPAAAIFSTFNLAFALYQPLVARPLPPEGPGTATAPSAPSAPPAAPRAPLPDISQRAGRLIADGLVTWYFFFAAWASLYLAISSSGQLRRAERRAANAERAAQTAQLRALRYQVNPHFLFNTLNSLSSLVLARRDEEAENMIVGLSTFFRASLSIDPTGDISLAEELKFQELYLDIEKVRFPNRLRVRFEVDEAVMGAEVPPLILQPIVENAIKHGVARTNETVTLTISAAEEDGLLRIGVENDRGPSAMTGDPSEAAQLGGNPAAPGAGVGLANVSERLHARFGAEAACEHERLPAGGYRVTIKMPLNDHV
ncbi:sensor histidine kinase [Sphingomonas parva]|uniref:Sensor histidine kinase n=2 Tax=Sphingomonas parva TaxID=2555898 RepID=A0A4Y8ZNL2_9SPHN|nr:sensor histidine kinase [Sphingomonas parva]